MYAVVRTGGKQYRVEPGMMLEVETLPGSVGDNVTLSEVLLVGGDKEVSVGQPLVEGATVTGQIVSQKKGPKLIVFKKIRRKGKHLKKGHRQALTRLRITDITTQA
jgi:large subunit ribosomal protein L21